jgi:hypothetical protein
MITRSAIILWALYGCSLLAGCDPSDPCDPGYRADHGFCFLIDAGFDWRSDAGSSDGGDAGEPASNPNAQFGSACMLQSDCGGVAPVCGGPMLPICTAINCIESPSVCPTGWTCIDVTKYMASAPGVNSVCIKL